MLKRLTSYEQETLINFNKAENTAYIFTYEKTWQQHIEKRLGINPTEDNGFVKYLKYQLAWGKIFFKTFV